MAYNYSKEYKGKKVTIRKEGTHYLICIGGSGYSLAHTKREAKRIANQFRKQLGREVR